MKPSKAPLLGYALLGLLQAQRQSGYDLRKLFTSTPLRTFSDSPGAIYPALRKLQQGGLVIGHVERRSGLRRRRVFRLTTAGTAALAGWLRRPVQPADVVRGMPELMLRFSFMDLVAGKAVALQFLRELERALTGYVPALRAYLKTHAAAMPLSGALALESGIEQYEATLRWARRSRLRYARKKDKK